MGIIKRYPGGGKFIGFRTSNGGNWFLSKGGISLNEGWGPINFALLRLRNDRRGKWMLYFYYFGKRIIKFYK